MIFNKKGGALSIWIIIALLVIILVGAWYIYFSDNPDREVIDGREPTDGGQVTEPPRETEHNEPPQQHEKEPTVDFVYSFNQLKSGDIDRIIHCTGPLFDSYKHDEYLETFSQTKSYMVRTDSNLGDVRFSPKEKVDQMKTDFNKYPNEIPLISMLYTKSIKDGGVIGLDKEVTEGKYDVDLKLYADMIKSFNKPVFVRIASEFNGDWSGYHKEYFADSFRYIVDFFRKEGVTNAVYMWNYMPLAEQFPYEQWYPGDDYVDWWSVDVFSNHFIQPAANKELMRFISDAKKHNKPIIIPESGPSLQGTSNIEVWEGWFVPFFELINGDSNIKGFCYSNEDFRKTTTLSTWKDVQLPGSPVVSLYQEELLKPQYLHQQS